MKIPKYSILENERRWIVETEFRKTLNDKPFKLIQDRYFKEGRLRLRSITDSVTSAKEFKLCKKYGPSGNSEPIVNIYLTQEEYLALSKIPANEITKKRFRVLENGSYFNVDVFEGNLEGLIICEIEAEDIIKLNFILEPSFVKAEVTTNPFFTGGALSKISFEKLKEQL